MFVKNDLHSSLLKSTSQDQVVVKIEDSNSKAVILVAAYISPTIQSLACAKRNELIHLVENLKTEFQTDDVVLTNGGFQSPKKAN